MLCSWVKYIGSMAASGFSLNHDSLAREPDGNDASEISLLADHPLSSHWLFHGP